MASPHRNERLAALEARLAAQSFRTVRGEGAAAVITYALELENGERIAGSGATNEAALAALEARAATLYPVPEAAPHA